MEYILYTDESDQKGQFYSNFYGGALILSKDLQEVETTLKRVKLEQNLLNELKWSKVSEQYLSKYLCFMDAYLDLMAKGKIKVRLMCNRTEQGHVGISKEMRVRQYFELYFRFIITAFGLERSNPDRTYRTLRINFDMLPYIDDAIFQFKHRLYDLNGTDFLQVVNLHIPMDNVSEVCSHDHVVIQGMDVFLGGWNFLLNEKQVFPLGRKTIAKNHLNAYLQEKITQMAYKPANTDEYLWIHPMCRNYLGMMRKIKPREVHMP